MKKILSFFSRLYWKLRSPESYARHIGVRIGEKCLISTRQWSSEPYLVTIGNNVQITRNVGIYTHGGGNCIRKDHPEFDVFGKVVIEDWAYIGAYSQIMPGVTIGEGALVAAGSVVTKSVAPFTVVAGNPARYLCTTSEYYEKNKKFDFMTKNLNSEQKKHVLMSSSEDMFIKR